MPSRLSRREVLRFAGLGAAAFLHPPFLTACAPSGGKGRGGADSGADALPPLVYDPGRSWWMQHNYGPVADEREAVELEVTGALPEELDGLYARNGSNPKHGDPGHWFLGNGMAHGVRLSGGRALWYRNRYLKTPLLDRVPSADAGAAGPPKLEDTAANVSLVHHAGRLLASGEVGLPYELSKDDLETIGVYDFSGKLDTSMTAHPKIDPVTGEMSMFAYWFEAPYATFHQVNAAGELVRSQPIDVPAPVMMHDFQVTETRVVFMDLPIVFDLAMAVAGNAFPFRWDPRNGARLGVMARAGGGVTWIDVDPCFVFHTLNAWDDPSGKLVLEVCRYEKLWVNGPDGFDAFPELHRYTLDPAGRTATLERLDERLIEFPQLDRRVAGRKNRYGYGLWLADPDGSQHPNGVRGIVKFDRTNDSSTVHEVDPALQPDETVFVPASATAGEDEGWLLTYVYDRRTDRTALHVLDASNMKAPPVAKVQLPYRVPFGFHGVWVPA